MKRPYELAISRGQAMAARPEDQDDSGSMLAVGFDEVRLEGFIAIQKPKVANYNSDEQTIIAGSTKEIDELKAELDKNGERSTKLQVSAAFHTPL